MCVLPLLETVRFSTPLISARLVSVLMFSPREIRTRCDHRLSDDKTLQQKNGAIIEEIVNADVRNLCMKSTPKECVQS